MDGLRLTATGIWVCELDRRRGVVGGLVADSFRGLLGDVGRDRGILDGFGPFVMAAAAFFSLGTCFFTL